MPLAERADITLLRRALWIALPTTDALRVSGIVVLAMGAVPGGGTMIMDNGRSVCGETGVSSVGDWGMPADGRASALTGCAVDSLNGAKTFSNTRRDDLLIAASSATASFFL